MPSAGRLIEGRGQGRGPRADRHLDQPGLACVMQNGRRKARATCRRAPASIASNSSPQSRDELAPVQTRRPGYVDTSSTG
jgi:hypothetical protein